MAVPDVVRTTNYEKNAVVWDEIDEYFEFEFFESDAGVERMTFEFDNLAVDLVKLRAAK